MDKDREKETSPSTSKSKSQSRSVSKSKTTSREGSTTSSDKTHAKDSKKSVKFVNQKKNNKTRPQNNASTSKDAQLHESVIRLHQRTKKVRAKLSQMTNKPKIPPTLTVLPSKSSQNTGTSANTLYASNALNLQNPPQDGLLTQEDLLREIKRLQELVKNLYIERKTSDSPPEKKSQPQYKSRKNDENDDDDSCGEDADNAGNNSKKSKRRRRRYKKKDIVRDESQLQELYISHINQIISKDSKAEDSEFPQFKNGDDLEEFATKCVDAGLGRIVEAELRVNAKNNHQSFITVEGGSDAMIISMATRRYAMDGDVVRAFIRNKVDGTRESVCELNESLPVLEDLNVTIDDPECVLVNDVEILKKSEDCLLPPRDRAFVIRIVKESGNRTFVGSIAFKNPSKHNDGEYLKFKTRDQRAPIMCIPVELCTEFFKKDQIEDAMEYLCVAQIEKIEENGRCLGKLIAPVGKCGNLEAEIKAILMHNHLGDVKPFEQRFEDMWNDPIKIEKSDLENREDLREECIFTIDPLTARDLDDAMSCRKLPNEQYEIGVHISDVTHYLQECSELDELVKLRATSIYLVNAVIHMLPQTLCMKCSLLPNEDKFAFSVFWIMDKEANVISTRFTRSIIRSCTQFAYEHAQKIIDNPNETFNDHDFPTICNGFNASDVIERIKILNSLSEMMRTRRFKNGSLSIDKPQFYFNLDPTTSEPISYEIANRLTANYLIEEFMLLANQSVAQLIYKAFPEIAFLRNHQPPKASAIKSLKVKLNLMGIELDMSTSKSIFEGLKKICGASSDPEVVSVAMNYLLTKPMMRAKYFCSENVDAETDLHHYALAIPIYTHFTSPIRRYPDIIVHRLLRAAIEKTPPPKRTPEELHQLARICNDQKFNAKNASEESSNLYFKRYINKQNFLIVRAVVVDIYKHSIEVITLDTGHLILVPFKNQDIFVDAKKAPIAIYLLENEHSKKPPLELKVFSPLDIKLKIRAGRLEGYFVLPKSEESLKSSNRKFEQKPDGQEVVQSSSSKSTESNRSKKKKERHRNLRKKAAREMKKEANDELL